VYFLGTCEKKTAAQCQTKYPGGWGQEMVFNCVDDTDKSKSHTWCPTVKKHIKEHEETMSWQTRSRKIHVEEFLARPNTGRPRLGVALCSIWDWAVRAWMLSLTLGQSPVKSNLKKWGLAATAQCDCGHGNETFLHQQWFDRLVSQNLHGSCYWYVRMCFILLPSPSTPPPPQSPRD